MSKIVEQFTAREWKILILENPLPYINFKKVSIDGTQYDLEIVYDMKNAIAIKAGGDFVGKEAEFVK